MAVYDLRQKTKGTTGQRILSDDQEVQKLENKIIILEKNILELNTKLDKISTMLSSKIN